MAVAILPSVLLPGVSVDSKQMAALVALFSGLMVLTEYTSDAPSLIEFRDAPPFNRCRFVLLLVLVALLALAERDRADPGTLTGLVAAIGALLAQTLDFSGSPVRLAGLMLQDGASDAALGALRVLAGLAYAVALAGTAIAVLVLRRAGWPWRGQAFNVWVNLPTFDPTAGHDVISRLKRDAGVNLALGILLPFLVPLAVRYGLGGFEAETLISSQTLIWVVTAWAFLPAALFLRGVAMLRVAQMVWQKRRDSALSFDGRFMAV